MKWFQGTADAVRQFTWVFEDAKNKEVENILILSGDHFIVWTIWTLCMYIVTLSVGAVFRRHARAGFRRHARAAFRRHARAAFRRHARAAFRHARAMFSKSWSEVTKVVKSLKEVQNTIKLQLVKSWKEVKDKYGGVDLESVAQRVSSPFGIIVGIAAVTSNASEKLVVVSQEQKEHLKAFRVSFQESCAHT